MRFIAKEPALMEQQLLVTLESDVELVSTWQPCVEVFHAGTEHVFIYDFDLKELFFRRQVTVELPQMIGVNMLEEKGLGTLVAFEESEVLESLPDGIFAPFKRHLSEIRLDVLREYGLLINQVRLSDLELVIGKDLIRLIHVSDETMLAPQLPYQAILGHVRVLRQAQPLEI